jgi:uncharacterized membrane protein
MERRGRISAFDRVGIVVVSILGTCIGLLIGVASDVSLTPAVALLFPGLVAGTIVSRLFGITAGVVACGVSNGAAYGLLLYGWYRLAAALRWRIPIWFAALANALARHGSR